jgi:hypothetical protein
MSERIIRSAKQLRWLARIFSSMIFLFWGFLIIGHLVGEQGQSSHPLTSQDYLILASLIVALVGLAIAWRWELVGASISILGLVVCAFFNWKVVLFPGTLIPLTAVLFLSSSLLLSYSRNGLIQSDQISTGR